MVRLITTTATILLATIAGCASWSDRTDSDPSKSPLAPVRESSKAVVLQLEFVPIGVDDVSSDDMESLWQWVDEAAFDTQSRSVMSDNGFRGGRLVRSDRFRDRLRQLKSGNGVVDDFLAQANVASDISQGGDRVPMRLGRRHEMNLGIPREGSLVTLIRLNNETIGRTLENPQYLFAVTPRSSREPGQIQLQLRPEIQFGGMRQRYVRSDSAIRIDTRRDSWSLDELDLNVTLSEGQTLVLAATKPAYGLGEQMFSGQDSNQEQQQLVVLIDVVRVPRIET